MNSFLDNNMNIIDYSSVEKALMGRPYHMSLTSDREINAVMYAVNQGIDAHLEACFVPDRGDSYKHGQRKVGDRVLCNELVCVVSVISLPVLLRRLSEPEDGETEDGETQEDADYRTASEELLGGIMDSLGFNESGVLREQQITDLPLLNALLSKGSKFWDLDDPYLVRVEKMETLHRDLTIEHKFMLEHEQADEFHACVLLGAINLVGGLLGKDE